MGTLKQNTHLLASEKLVGTVISITKNNAKVSLKITKEMVVDTFNLAHGSFTFGLADYAAMVSINEPTVVLGQADTKYLKPVILNDVLIANAKITATKGKKVTVLVNVTNQKSELVFEGNFTCFVLEKHILE